MTMTYPATREPIGEVLSADEYDALPENARRELVDGVIHMQASPTAWHQDVARALMNALDRCGKPTYRATGPIEVRFGPKHRRNPDVVVLRATDYRRRAGRVLPEHVVLAVEIVSPGSETTDRDHKPAEYAAGGITHFWRVELEPELVVHTHRLDGRRYVHSGAFGVADTVHVDELEWAAVAVADLDV